MEYVRIQLSAALSLVGVVPHPNIALTALLHQPLLLHLLGVVVVVGMWEMEYVRIQLSAALSMVGVVPHLNIVLATSLYHPPLLCCDEDIATNASFSDSI